MYYSKLRQAPQYVLLVDDEPSVLSIVDLVLRRAGYEVIATPDPEKALELARNADVPIDLLLTDVSMPRLEGPELAARIGGISPRTKVLFMTGHAARSAQAGGLPQNALVLRKPFQPRELVQRVQSVLAHAASA